MKRNNLHVRVMIAGFLLILILVIAVFCLTFCNRTNITPELLSSISEIEELTTETTVTTTGTSFYTSTETTTLIEESTTATPVEETTITEATTETVLEEESETLQASTSASAELTTEMTSTLQTTIATPTTALKSVEEIAREVWRGLWGVGDDRKERLEAAGYNYDEVQKVVCQVGHEFETNPNPVEDTPSGLQIQFVKTFSRGTYYAYGGPRKGGSGRQLIDCSQGSGGIKGSIASWYLYDNYRYNYGGERTTVYLEVEGYPQMNGFYYLDDSCAPGYNDVIDFFFLYNSNCPFQYQGVVKVNCFIVK